MDGILNNSILMDVGSRSGAARGGGGNLTVSGRSQGELEWSGVGRLGEKRDLKYI